MNEPTLTHVLVDVMFTCPCGEMLNIIDSREKLRCRGCDKVYGVKLEIVEDAESEETTDLFPEIG